MDKYIYIKMIWLGIPSGNLLHGELEKMATKKVRLNPLKLHNEKESGHRRCVSFPVNSMVMFLGYEYVYQRVITVGTVKQ